MSKALLKKNELQFSQKIKTTFQDNHDGDNSKPTILLNR